MQLEAGAIRPEQYKHGCQIATQPISYLRGCWLCRRSADIKNERWCLDFDNWQSLLPGQIPAV